MPNSTLSLLRLSSPGPLRPSPARSVFSTPTFKEYASSELKGCGKNAFPAFSITAGGCALMCDHCQAKILEPMIPPATNPAMLDQKVRDLILLQDLQGFLLSGGSNRKNEIAYERFLPVIEGLKRDFPSSERLPSTRRCSIAIGPKPWSPPGSIRP